MAAVSLNYESVLNYISGRAVMDKSDTKEREFPLSLSLSYVTRKKTSRKNGREGSWAEILSLARRTKRKKDC